MARITVEKCLEHVPSRFDLILLASGRARQLSTTSREPMVETNNDYLDHSRDKKLKILQDLLC